MGLLLDESGGTELDNHAGREPITRSERCCKQRSNLQPPRLAVFMQGKDRRLRT